MLDKPAGLLAVPLERRERGDVDLRSDRRSHAVARQAEAARRASHRSRHVGRRAVRQGRPDAGRAEAAVSERERPSGCISPSSTAIPIRRQARGAITSCGTTKALIQKETHPRDPRAAEAISEYRVVETFEATSLIEVRLTTGKRNQIRIQARLRGPHARRRSALHVRPGRASPDPLQAPGAPRLAARPSIIPSSSEADDVRGAAAGRHEEAARRPALARDATLTIDRLTTTNSARLLQVTPESPHRRAIGRLKRSHR